MIGTLKEITEGEFSLILDSLNCLFHQSIQKLQDKNLGTLERQLQEKSRDMSKELLDKLTGH